MNSWTVSRRIIVGFATMLLITAILGIFSLWRLMMINKDLTELADNTLPSVLLLNDCASQSRDNMVLAERLLVTESKEEQTRLNQLIDENRAVVDELLKRYEVLVSDSEDRRLFAETKQTRANYAKARDRMLELVRQDKVGEATKWLNDSVVPSYEALIKAVQAEVEHNNQLGMAAGNDGKKLANRSVTFIRAFMIVAIIVASLLAWQVTRTTNRVLHEVATGLDQGAVQTAAAAGQVSAASQNLSSGASEQASSVEETSASLEEMSSMIRATAENAQKAKTLAGEARSVAVAGSQTMVEMNQAMAAIDTSSAEVAKIVKNIDEIAFQTNILALNAAVEAARAGEAGAGFAVVADEVRSLAQRSAAAAKETADKIDAAIASSRQGSRSCAKVGESLTQIAEKVSSTDSLVGEIATAAREQAQGIEQINIAMAQMDKVTQSNSASAEESASAAEELDAQAASLKDMVGQLRKLVGCVASPANPPAPTPPSRYKVSSSPASPSSARSVPRAISGGERKAIPMPDDSVSRRGDQDDNFRNF